MDDDEEVVDLLGGERRGRLIHDEHPRVGGERLGDLDHLLLGDRQVPDHHVRVDVDVQASEDRPRLPLHLPLGEHARFGALASEEDVFGDRQVLAHVQLLVDDRHAHLLRLFGGEVRGDLLAEELHRAAVAGVDAAQDLHERGLSRAVFPEQGHHLARAQVEGDVVQRLDAGEGLVDMFHLNDIILHPIHLSFPCPGPCYGFSIAPPAADGKGGGFGLMGGIF